MNMREYRRQREGRRRRAASARRAYEHWQEMTLDHRMRQIYGPCADCWGMGV